MHDKTPHITAIEDISDEDLQAFIDAVTPSEAELKQADEHVTMLVLSQGTFTDGLDYYAYLAIPPSNYVEFIKHGTKGGYTLGEYGEILACGDGQEPPEEVKQRMADLYGANPNFLTEMGQLLRKVARDIDPISVAKYDSAMKQDDPEV